MRMSLPAYRSRLLSVAVVAAFCGVAASCSGVIGEKELFTGSTDNQRQIIGTSADEPLPAPTNAVTSADLPPPPGAVATSAPLSSSGPTVMPVNALGGIDGARGADGATDSAPFGWSAVGGTVITVGTNDSLDGLAAKYGVPQNQILNSNQMSSASQVTPGRILVIPHRVPLAPGQTAQAAPAVATPVTPIPAAAQTLTASGTTYTVMTGDTLFSISQRFNANADSIIALNGLGSQSQLRTGQVLKIPAGAAGASGPAAIPRIAPATPTTAAVAAATPTIAGVVPKPTPAPSLAPTAAQIAANMPPKIATPAVDNATGKSPATPAVSGGTQIPPTQASLNPNATLDAGGTPSANGTTFQWPVRGRIIEGFGGSTGGERNDGINLSVPEGTSVKAAEAGTVIYAGNELQGYGNLILIRHASGWVTAYAHNKDLLVKRGDTVTRGQTIAHAGMTGSVTAPQVHFELRKGSTPVNPLDYLSG